MIAHSPKTSDDCAYQVERADVAETHRAMLRHAADLILRQHDDCVCRHARRVLRYAIEQTEWPTGGPAEAEAVIGTSGQEKGANPFLNGYQNTPAASSEPTVEKG